MVWFERNNKETFVFPPCHRLFKKESSAIPLLSGNKNYEQVKNLFPHFDPRLSLRSIGMGSNVNLTVSAAEGIPDTTHMCGRSLKGSPWISPCG